MMKVEAPFTEDQVASLNEFQGSDRWHPFTCTESIHGPLVATQTGWVCRSCNYTQGWAHEFMTDWTWKQLGVKIEKIKDHYERQTEDEAVKEDNAGEERSWM